MLIDKHSPTWRSVDQQITDRLAMHRQKLESERISADDCLRLRARIGELKALRQALLNEEEIHEPE